MNSEILAAVVAGLFTVIIAIIAAYQNIKNARANAISQLTESYRKVLERLDELQTVVDTERSKRRELQEEIEEEKRNRRRLQSIVLEYQLGVPVLISQLLAMGIEPKWVPPEYKDSDDKEGL